MNAKRRYVTQSGAAKDVFDRLRGERLASAGNKATNIQTMRDCAKGGYIRGLNLFNDRQETR